MESNNDIAYNRLKILSQDESYSVKSGSLLSNGGIGCKKTITSKNIVTDCLNVKKDTKISGNLTIDNNTY